jgi:hypothetical protein
VVDITEYLASLYVDITKVVKLHAETQQAEGEKVVTLKQGDKNNARDMYTSRH